MRKVKRIATGVTAMACTASLALAGTAGATTAATPPTTAPTHHPFPVATRICEEIAKGGGTAAQRAEATAILAACTALQTGYTADQAAFVAAITPVHAALLAARTAITTPCNAGTQTVRAACVLTRKTARLQRPVLEAQRRTILKGHEAQMKTLRVTWWTTYDALLKQGATMVHAANPQHHS